MNFQLSVVAKALAGTIAAGMVWASPGHADPAQDGVAKLKDLTQKAEQIIGSVQAAQADLETKLQLQSEAERRYLDDRAALEAASAKLAVQQGVVDKLAAAVYMGGRADGAAAILTSASPAGFIERLSVQRTMSTTATEQMLAFRQAQQQAQAIEAASAESAIAAKAAADSAAAVRADLEKQRSRLQAQVAEVKLQYGLLPPAQQALLGPGAAIPTVGMGGLVPNARALAAYVIATFPGVEAIGGVRSDPLPDHPSGHAIDIMIGSNMALGDAINADIQSQAGRFGVSYTMWRVANHFNHVHVTVN